MEEGLSIPEVPFSSFLDCGSVVRVATATARISSFIFFSSSVSSGLLSGNCRIGVRIGICSFGAHS